MTIECIVALIIILPFTIFCIVSTHGLSKSLDAYDKAEQELNDALAEYIKFKMIKGDF